MEVYLYMLDDIRLAMSHPSHTYTHPCLDVRLGTTKNRSTGRQQLRGPAPRQGNALRGDRQSKCVVAHSCVWKGLDESRMDWQGRVAPLLSIIHLVYCCKCVYVRAWV